ncbi:hypothetical protein [Aquibium microcysteis]|uniref:hypothetical protein n=1 Tax=Aquibium microcysteis TaxID=675281 RepID=UPI00165CF646|nr:hypothetical protein [Aquibium microcysteis]
MPTFVDDAPETAPEPTTVSGPSPIPSSRQADQYLLLLLLMLCIIVVPLILALGWIVITLVSASDFKIPVNGPLAQLLFAVAADPSRYIGSITAILLPTSAAVTAANYDKIDIRGWGSTLFLIPLAGLIAALIAALLVDVALRDETKDVKAVSNMFINMSGSLAVYVMMLVGLKAGAGTPESRNANGND